MTRRSSSAPPRRQPSGSERLALVARDCMRATGRGPLRLVWMSLYGAASGALTLALRLCAPGSTIFARGSWGERRLLFGYSDLDLVAVAPEARGATRIRRWLDRAFRTLPLMRKAVDVAVTTRAEIESASAAPFVCPATPARERTRTALPRGLGISFFGRLRRWRRLAGQRLDLYAPICEEHRLLWAWAEAQFRWKHLLRSLLSEQDRLQAAHLASAALAGLAQVAAWAEIGEERLDPEAAAALAPAHWAAVVEAALRRSEGGAGVEPLEALPAMAAVTHALSNRIDRFAGSGSRLRLIGMHEKRSEAPLLDWRSLVFPAANETMRVMPGQLSDAALLVEEAVEDGRRRTAIVDGRLLLLPIRPGSPADRFAAQGWVMRSVQSAVSDPVAWALARGHATAVFSRITGWSLEDWSRRSVAELRLRLEKKRFEAAGPERRNARLMASTRAAALAKSLNAGEPELLVSDRAVLDWLEDRRPELRGRLQELNQRTAEAWRSALVKELERVCEAALPAGD